MADIGVGSKHSRDQLGSSVVVATKAAFLCYRWRMRTLLIPADPTALRENNFNTMRLFMALLVVWSHSFAIFLGSEDNEPISLLLNGSYNAGNIGVLVFFVISGFLISHSFQHSKSIRNYMVRRIRRIHPGFIVATTICAFVVVPLNSSMMKMDASEVVKVFGLNALLQNYMPPSTAFATNPVPGAVNGSLWSISFEFWCYIFVAALGVVGLAKSRWLLVAAVLAILVARVILDIFGLKPGLGLIGDIIGWPYLWTKVLPSFLFGMIAYNFRDLIPRSLGLLVVLLAASLVAAHISATAVHLIFPAAMAYSVFYLAFSPLKLPDAAKWGDISYGTYLYAFPIQQMLAASYLFTLSFAELLGLSMVLSLGAGIFSWHIVEKHFLARTRKPNEVVPLDTEAKIVAP